MKLLTLLPALAICAVISSCSTGTGIDMPKGNVANYQSATLIARNPNAENFGSPQSKAFKNKVHGMIKKSLKSEFSRQGVAYGKSQSDLTVAYLILLQNKAITYHYNDYFGHGPNANEIARIAHERGVIEKEVSNYHNRAGILVDVIDQKTQQIVYRNFYATDVIHVPSDSARAARIDYAVRSALAPFFVKTP
jgi:hypothetical protein